MDEQFDRFTKDINEVIANSTRSGKKESAIALMRAFKELHSRGVQAYDFAHVALIFAETSMSHFDTLEENVKFGEFMKEAGASKIRCVSDHWPPVDANKWPAGIPSNITG